jgi:hypothetical protein
MFEIAESEKMRVLLVMLSCWAILGQTLSPASLTDQDRARFKAILAQVRR